MCSRYSDDQRQSVDEKAVVTASSSSTSLVARNWKSPHHGLPPTPVSNPALGKSTEANQMTTSPRIALLPPYQQSPWSPPSGNVDAVSSSRSSALSHRPYPRQVVSLDGSGTGVQLAPTLLSQRSPIPLSATSQHGRQGLGYSPVLRRFASTVSTASSTTLSEPAMRNFSFTAYSVRDSPPSHPVGPAPMVCKESSNYHEANSDPQSGAQSRSPNSDLSTSPPSPAKMAHRATATSSSSSDNKRSPVDLVPFATPSSTSLSGIPAHSPPERTRQQQSQSTVNDFETSPIPLSSLPNERVDWKESLVARVREHRTSPHWQRSKTNSHERPHGGRIIPAWSSNSPGAWDGRMRSPSTEADMFDVEAASHPSSVSPRQHMISGTTPHQSRPISPKPSSTAALYPVLFKPPMVRHKYNLLDSDTVSDSRQHKIAGTQSSDEAVLASLYRRLATESANLKLERQLRQKSLM